MKEKPKRYWHGSKPVECQRCDAKLSAVFVDGKLMNGWWGKWCPACHSSLGMGLGIGLGQRYVRQADGRWLKTGG